MKDRYFVIERIDLSQGVRNLAGQIVINSKRHDDHEKY